MGSGKLDPVKVGLRAQDIQTSLQDVDLGPLGAETKNLRLLGMAERLAIHIRGTDVIDDYKRLEYIGSQFGIDSLVLPSVLNVLEELEWVRVEGKGAKRKVEESVPFFRDIYSAAGKYFLNTNPGEVEQGTITVCDSLALSPMTEYDLRKRTGLDSKAYQMIHDIGASGKFIDEYRSERDKVAILYSPLYWVEHPQKLEAMYELLKQFGADHVYNVLKKIRDYQGLPLLDEIFKKDPKSLGQEQNIISEAIRRGIIMAPQVSSFKGQKNFGFTPHIGVPLEEKSILEKAILALGSEGHPGFRVRLSILDNLGRATPSASWPDSGAKSVIHVTRFRRRFFFSGALKDPAGACRTCTIAQYETIAVMMGPNRSTR
ncbi:MAG: hypothetical protein A2038_11040 [Deltaproteobacteria bacterium GWA2_57_13]|nr:MAG: hypothetical protein A2038_11040 [Deltaproteobacteria bacterium GWA2_57_13]